MQGHTAGTLLMQRSAGPWKAAGFLGISVELIPDTYGHHHPEFSREEAAVIYDETNQEHRIWG
jgi:hypothetical protein